MSSAARAALPWATCFEAQKIDLSARSVNQRRPGLWSTSMLPGYAPPTFMWVCLKNYSACVAPRGNHHRDQR